MTSPLHPFRKIWHPRHRWYARLRALWLIVVCRHETEICNFCGGRVEVVWHADDSLWHEVMGKPGGVLCVACFDRLAEETGPFLRWTAVRDGA